MSTTTERPLALVTGASTGIGFELAKVFADRVSAKMHSTQAEPGSAEDS